MNAKRLLLAAAATTLTAAPLLTALPAAAEPTPAKSATMMAAPRTISPTLNGDIAFVVEGRRLPANQALVLNSTSLNSACTGGTSLGADKVVTDRSGYFSFPATAKGCVEGSYRIEATEQQTPFRSYSTMVTVAMVNTPEGITAFTANPSAARANDDGDVAFVLDGFGFPSNSKVVLNATALSAACKTTSLRNTPTQADRDGRFTLPAVGKACIPGNYIIEATEQQTPFTTHITMLTVKN